MEAALQLFLEKDITQITMKEIGARAGISRVTLYKYYNSLHEIAFDVHCKVLSELHRNHLQQIDKGGDGAHKLQLYFASFAEILHTNPDIFRFTAFFDLLFREYHPAPEQEAKYKELLKKGQLLMTSILEEGARDGSMRSDLSIPMTAEMIQFSLMNMAQKIAIRGKMLKMMRGTEPDAVMAELFGMIKEYTAPRD
ncbi:TetR/AcrR family transcriptional regulator [Paenibacillus oralis]|nr:TetR/AcrR family transcriptional regulator [Paenibacillus oralis]